MSKGTLTLTTNDIERITNDANTTVVKGVINKFNNGDLTQTEFDSFMNALIEIFGLHKLLTIMATLSK